MAEESKKESGKKKLPLKMILIMAGMLLIEGAAITAAFWFAGGPTAVKADPLANTAAIEAEQPVEHLVIRDKFQNTRTGRNYLYDTEVYVTVPKKHEEHVKKALEAQQGQLRAEIATIFRRAEPAHLNEHDRATITRQIDAVLQRHLKQDAEGEPYIRSTFISKMVEHRADI